MSEAVAVRANHIHYFWQFGNPVEFVVFGVQSSQYEYGSSDILPRADDIHDIYVYTVYTHVYIL